MHLYAPALIVPGMLSVAATVLFTALITFVQQSINRKKMELSPKLQSFVYSLFSGIQKIKVTGSEKRAFSKWAQSYSEVKALDYSPPFIIKVSGVINLIISSVSTIAIYYFAASSFVSLSDYQSFNEAFGGVSGAIMALSGIVLQIANLGPILDMVKPLIECEPESSESKKIVTSLSGEIEVNKIKFRYDENGPLILDDINIKIKKGEYVGIVGKTGCGKSTLLRLLLGFEKPEHGEIYYGKGDIKNLDLKSLRQNVGVVMQNGSLFPGDIFSNIVVTSPWKTLQDAWSAAEMAGIDEEIKAMPMGMHTVIAEGTGGISGGQKQRIMIARALIGKPSILFFDEATSALDNITQHHISENISRLRCTRLVIAHRLSTIKNCDRILVMDQGKIVEEGKYEDLMQKKGRFYELAIRQVVK
jgi:ABC-type bacteriocin/lantibiotic exporter with double-glycine peptidase domain